MDQNELFFFLVTIRLMSINFKVFFTTNEIEDCGWCTIKNDVNENNVELIIIYRLNNCGKIIEFDVHVTLANFV